MSTSLGSSSEQMKDFGPKFECLWVRKKVQYFAALRTSHLPAPADGSYYRRYIPYWKEKNLVKRWVIAL